MIHPARLILARIWHHGGGGHMPWRWCTGGGFFCQILLIYIWVIHIVFHLIYYTDGKLQSKEEDRSVDIGQVAHLNQLDHLQGLHQLWQAALGGQLIPEAEKPRRRVGIADRKVFARPESFCACPQNWPKKQVKNISLERFRTVWKVSRQSGRFLESFSEAWKVFGQSGKFPGS